MEIYYNPEIVLPQGTGYNRNANDEKEITDLADKIYTGYQNLIDSNEGYIHVETNSRDKVFIVELRGNETILDKIQSGEISAAYRLPFSDKNYM